MSGLDYDIFADYAISDYPVLPVHRLLRILGFACFFRLLTWFSHRFFNLQHETAFRITSVCHACIAFFNSLHLFIYGAQPFYPIPITYCKPIPLAEPLFCVSYGYFLYDLHKNVTHHGGIAFILHGFFCIVSYSIFTFQPCAQRAGLACLLYEGSTIWLHTYAFLYYNGYEKLAGYTRLVFAFMFILLRIIFGTYITIEVFDVLVFRRIFVNVDNSCCTPVPVFIGLLINVLFQILNWHWLLKIIEKALETFKKGEKLTQLEKGKELDFDKYRNTALKNDKKKSI